MGLSWNKVSFFCFQGGSNFHVVTSAVTVGRLHILWNTDRHKIVVILCALSTRDGHRMRQALEPLCVGYLSPCSSVDKDLCAKFVPSSTKRRGSLPSVLFCAPKDLSGHPLRESTVSKMGCVSGWFVTGKINFLPQFKSSLKQSFACVIQAIANLYFEVFQLRPASFAFIK